MKRSLTRPQAAEVLRAASMLAPAAREAFLAAVDSCLSGIRHKPSDGDVAAAIVSVLGDNQTITTSCFLCDAAPRQEASMATTDDDDDAFDERGLLRDGKRTYVSLMMKDSLTPLQRAIAQDAATRRGFDDSQAKQQPGPVFADRSAARQAYEDAKAEAQDAWRNPAPDAVRGQKPGDVCTINGAPGHLNARLECVPDRQDAADRRRKRKGVSRDPFGRETGSWEEEEEDSAPAASDARRTMTVDEGRRVKAQAYAEYVRDLENGWRTP